MTEKRAARPPMESVRQASFNLVRAADDDEPNDGLTLDGYGAVFNSVTVIDSYEGRFKEQNAPGSMKRSFRETPPKIQFDHGRHPLIGSIPIAALQSVTEDSHPELAPNGGAHIIGRVFGNWLMEPVRDAIEAGAINGMSYRFTVVREQWQYPDGKIIRDEDELKAELRKSWYDDIPEDELLLRTLKEMKVPEMGPVVWPAYEASSVSVRSKVIDLGRLHDPEQRKLLATAVFLADTAEQEDAQRDTTSEVDDTAAAAVESPSTETLAELDKALAPVGLRASNPDAQQSTPAVGERPSKPRGRRAIDLMRNRSRDNLIRIKSEGKKL